MRELTENIEEGELIFSLASITRFNFEDQKKMQSSSKLWKLQFEFLQQILNRRKCMLGGGGGLLATDGHRNIHSDNRIIQESSIRIMAENQLTILNS